ncbi:nucleoside-diphosphate sugar epimerase/dehydratase [Hydrogenophaga sp.]|uniref:polysaccharide biosynthesis protein n=1 Tax=Hydrogenophaga sp. TaxID=1904254 RepID=UPI00262CCAFD|nr:nucleoside-diphosphate sugar epimerase/dehydratase [Hydrogenophaga sp.]MDM7948451.1 nucleoside-diphosphate sugar epimerase/dehydratase [Hydrogenophaga sp.]
MSTSNKVHSLIRLDSRWLQLPIDLALVAAVWWFAFWLRFNLDTPDEFQSMMVQTLVWPLLAFAASLLGFGVYRHIWRYTSVAELTRLSYAVALGGLLTAAAILMLRVEFFPRSVLLLHPLLALVALGAARALARIALSGAEPSFLSGKPLLLVGSVQDAAAALPALRGLRQWTPVGIVSPVAAEQGRSLQGLSVVGVLADLPRLAQRLEAAAALVVSAPGTDARRAALMGASEVGLPLLTMPRPDEWLRNDHSQPRRVELEDLLGRAPVALDEQGLSELLTGQTVMVTGAGGSIGSELCRQIARFGVRRLVCVDVSEYAIYQLERELAASHPQMQGLYYTGNVREFERLLAIAEQHRPATVFHAAAYKHVPLMESLNEIEALRTNVLGTLNAARVAGRVGAQRFVLISTDKAVNPTNVMGASKRLAEQVLQSVAVEFAQTRYVAVRFGNVLGSSGSVVPLFTSQIGRGGPVTVTHPDIVRYFMTIPEAAQLVLQASLMGQTRQIFVLDMGEPVKIVDLARLLIRLSGQTEQNIPISFTGLRPGEKLFEELLANDETTEPTPHAKLRVAKGADTQVDTEAVLQWIASAGPAPSAAELRVWLQSLVPEYQPVQ